MQLENETPFPARLLRLERSENDIQSTLIVKSSFEKQGKRWLPAQEQMSWVGEKLDTPFGSFHSDFFVHKAGVDLCVLGTVRSAEPEREVKLRLECGEHVRELRVFGDRRWMRRGSDLVASDPLPFRELPLAYSHAYGGTTEYDYEQQSYQDNPVGRGYYLSAEAATDQLLPNIEPGDWNGPRTWSTEVPVAGWAPYPLFWGMRAREGILLRDENAPPQPLARVHPRANNNAHPTLVFETLPAAPIRVHGMRPEELCFELPRPKLVAELVVGDQVTEREGRLDGVFLWVDAERVTLTHRMHYRYDYRKGERRQIRLTTTAEGD